MPRRLARAPQPARVGWHSPRCDESGAMVDGRPILLMLRAQDLGDLLTTVPAMRALAAAFPTHRRVLVTTELLAPFAVRAGLAEEAVPIRRLVPLVWRHHRPAIAVDLHDAGPESHRVLLETYPARLIAFRHPLVPQSWDAPEWHADEDDVLRWCRLLDRSGVAADPSRLEIALPPRPVPAEAIDATVLHPGDAGGRRRWPLERWVEIALAESLEGRVVLITGSAAERSLGLVIAHRAGLPPSVVWAGRTDPLALAAIVHRAARVVCGDTGIAHLATALRTPSVVLSGSHGATADAGLASITVQDVLTALADLPAATARRASTRPLEPAAGSSPASAFHVPSGTAGPPAR